jgi:hypothetical protein
MLLLSTRLCLSLYTVSSSNFNFFKLPSFFTIVVCVDAALMHDRVDLLLLQLLTLAEGEGSVKLDSPLRQLVFQKEKYFFSI